MKDSTTSLPAPAGEPEMPALPEPVFTLWRRADGTLMGYKKLMADGPWLTVQEAKVYARAWGDARAEHARRVERERCAGVLRYWLGGSDGKSHEGRCLAHINSGKADPRERAAAPPQGEPK